MSSSSFNDCCNCVEGMAEKLEKFENFFVHIFEGNEAFVFGTIRKVIDGEVLHMEDVLKQVFLPGGQIFNFFYDDLYVSICEISQFAPLFEVTLATATQVATMQNELLQKTNAITVVQKL